MESIQTQQQNANTSQTKETKEITTIKKGIQNKTKRNEAFYKLLTQ